MKEEGAKETGWAAAGQPSDCAEVSLLRLGQVHSCLRAYGLTPASQNLLGGLPNHITAGEVGCAPLRPLTLHLHSHLELWGHEAVDSRVDCTVGVDADVAEEKDQRVCERTGHKELSSMSVKSGLLRAAKSSTITPSFSVTCGRVGEGKPLEPGAPHGWWPSKRHRKVQPWRLPHEVFPK